MNVKKIIVLIISVIIFFNIVFSPKTFAFSEIFESGKSFLEAGEAENEVIDETKLEEVNSKIYNILLMCGIGVAAIVGAVLGITFILSSVEGKAKVSEALIPYIVGCFVVFGAFGIWKITINIGNSITETSTTYTRAEDGTLYCDGCGDPLGTREQRNGKCNCGKEIEGI